MLSQPGLEWEQPIWGSTPHWSTEPSMKILIRLAHHHVQLPDDSDLELLPLEEVALN